MTTATMGSREKIHLAFDVGHSSIGWAVLERPKAPDSVFPHVSGCGVVTFQSDDCLASKRRDFRRQRRHIRATRQRIERMKLLIEHMGCLGRTELDKPGCAWPWLLAAQVLKERKPLTWPELWNILRWYAHNRGYDGNRGWSISQESESAEDDTEKLGNARDLMDKHHASSMAETLCAELGLPSDGQKRASRIRVKGVLEAAFPRDIVVAEVGRILHAQFGKLKGVDEHFATTLFSDWTVLPCKEIKLPNRYNGGLLFGQLHPRFDNRIISKCPITGHKVPLKNTSEFLRFRWAMILANIRVSSAGQDGLRALSCDERCKLDQQMQERGAMTEGELKKAVREVTCCEIDNLDTMLMHPDAARSLHSDPLRELTTRKNIAPHWATLPPEIQARARGWLRRGKQVTLGSLRGALTSPDAIAAFDAAQSAAPKTGRGRKKPTGETDPLATVLRLQPEPGRAPYSRPILLQATKEVMTGKDPRAEGGCLYITDEMRKREQASSVDNQTNNHLVRHRLVILERLTRDVVNEFAAGDYGRVSQITIEVNRDLRTMSGKTTKERAQEQGARLADFKHTTGFLEEQLADNPAQITAGLIRKVRIAQDLEWKCPYTGKEYGLNDILSGAIDKDHVVPRADRTSDSLDSLVLTFSAVNKMKGRRTALQFISDEASRTVPDTPNLAIYTKDQYEEFVRKLDSRRGHGDDQARKKRRKELMSTLRYEAKEFLPRDLTITSQLVRLGAQALGKLFAGVKTSPRIISLPGSVTGMARRSWGLLGCLSRANPQAADKTKTEIRDITHLHHALDACVLGMVNTIIPANGAVWSAMIRRKPSLSEWKTLHDTGAFARDNEGGVQMLDVPKDAKDNLGLKLAERRVVQHMPVDMGGLKSDETVWRLMDFADNSPSTLKLKQLFHAKNLPELESNAATAYIIHWKRKGKGLTAPSKILKETNSYWIEWDEVAKKKLIGLAPGKLSALKAVKVISENYGIALDPVPEVIPFHKVWHQLKELKLKNAGKTARVLRNGQIINIPTGRYQGVWRIFSCKANSKALCVDIGKPDVVRYNGPSEGMRINVNLGTLIKDGLTVQDCKLTGVPCPSTSSILTRSNVS